MYMYMYTPSHAMPLGERNSKRLSVMQVGFQAAWRLCFLSWRSGPRGVSVVHSSRCGFVHERPFEKFVWMDGCMDTDREGWVDLLEEKNK